MVTPKMMIDNVESDACETVAKFLDANKENLCTAHARLTELSQWRSTIFKAILVKSGWTVFEKLDDQLMKYTLIISSIEKSCNPKSAPVWTPQSIWERWVEEVQNQIKETMNTSLTQQVLYSGEFIRFYCENNDKTKITKDFLELHGWETVGNKNNVLFASCPKTNIKNYVCVTIV
jgi:hypothetical protein